MAPGRVRGILELSMSRGPSRDVDACEGARSEKSVLLSSATLGVDIRERGHFVHAYRDDGRQLAKRLPPRPDNPVQTTKELRTHTVHVSSGLSLEVRTDVGGGCPSVWILGWTSVGCILLGEGFTQPVAERPQEPMAPHHQSLRILEEQGVLIGYRSRRSCEVKDAKGNWPSNMVSSGASIAVSVFNWRGIELSTTWVPVVKLWVLLWGCRDGLRSWLPSV